MKTIIAATMLAGAALAETVQTLSVSEVSFTQNRATQKVYIDYKLQNQGEPAFVTIDVLTNGVSIGREHIKSLSGDVSTSFTDFVADDGNDKHIVWDAHRDWAGHVAEDATVNVCAYYKDFLYEVPGVYMVVDLSGGADAESYPVAYTFTPPEPGDDITHSSQLWLKRIEPGTFTMGSPATEPNRSTEGWETQHQVTLTKPFFIGVYELTEEQYRLVTGITRHNPSSVAGTLGPAMVTFNHIRATSADYQWTLETIWPQGTDPVEGSFADKLSKRTGFRFDLPTDAQWEYACRAGTTTAYYNGLDPIEGASWIVDPNLDPIAWYRIVNDSPGVHRGGRKLANPWGLYDMLGNVREVVLDAAVADIRYYNVDPKGAPSPAASTARVGKGGSHSGGRDACRPAQRHWTCSLSTASDNSLGARLAVHLD